MENLGLTWDQVRDDPSYCDLSDFWILPHQIKVKIVSIEENVKIHILDWDYEFTFITLSNF